MSVSVTLGDCMAVLAARDGPLFDCCVTDPPYHLTSIVKRFGKADSAPCKEGATGAYARSSRGFMGKEWDGGDIAFRPELWRAVYDQIKPGAHLIAFSGTRTYHRMACAIEDAGFEIRDQLQWIYGSGFPKSHDVSKGIDKAAGAERQVVGSYKGASNIGKGSSNSYIVQVSGHATNVDVTAPATDEARQWQGWGTALKPAHEPICLARKPLSEKSIAANVVKHGTGAINVDSCRVGTDSTMVRRAEIGANGVYGTSEGRTDAGSENGRWPANILHDGSDEVTAGFPETGDGVAIRAKGGNNIFSDKPKPPLVDMGYGGGGSAARFFYSAKAGPLDRLGSPHPTVKPVDVMRWLVRLVTPPGGLILDPFAGSGTTGIAAMAEGFDCELIDLMPDHVADIERKLAFLRGEGRLTVQEHINGREARKDASASALPILDWLAA